MEHLTVDDMIQFVSMTKLNAETLELAASVNGHIRRCRDCAQRVRAFQMIHDEFKELYACDTVRERIQERIRELHLEQENRYL